MSECKYDEDDLQIQLTPATNQPAQFLDNSKLVKYQFRPQSPVSQTPSRRSHIGAQGRREAPQQVLDDGETYLSSVTNV